MTPLLFPLLLSLLLVSPSRLLLVTAQPPHTSQANAEYTTQEETLRTIDTQLETASDITEQKIIKTMYRDRLNDLKALNASVGIVCDRLQKAATEIQQDTQLLAVYKKIRKNIANRLEDIRERGGTEGADHNNGGFLENIEKHLAELVSNTPGKLSEIRVRTIHKMWETMLADSDVLPELVRLAQKFQERVEKSMDCEGERKSKGSDLRHYIDEVTDNGLGKKAKKSVHEKCEQARKEVMSLGLGKDGDTFAYVEQSVLNMLKLTMNTPPVETEHSAMSRRDSPVSSIDVDVLPVSLTSSQCIDILSGIQQGIKNATAMFELASSTVQGLRSSFWEGVTGLGISCDTGSETLGASSCEMKDTVKELISKKSSLIYEIQNKYIAPALNKTGGVCLSTSFLSNPQAKKAFELVKNHIDCSQMIDFLEKLQAEAESRPEDEEPSKNDSIPIIRCDYGLPHDPTKSHCSICNFAGDCVSATEQ
eukprot:Nk52_evm14s207 gene=Nk52_evmTU14s207